MGMRSTRDSANRISSCLLISPIAHRIFKRFPVSCNWVAHLSTDEVSTSQLSPEDENEKLQEYFNQYIEEYYEEAAVDEEQVEQEDIDRKRNALPASIRALLREEQSVDGVLSVQELVEVLRAERAADIVCVRVPPSEGPYHNIIICSPYNRTHGQALVQTIRKCIKLKTSSQEVEAGRLVKSSGGWHCLELGNTILHVMSAKVRQKYDLETLWTVGDEEEADGMHDVFTICASDSITR
ncbi:Uncharacterized protein K12H4.2 [Toxocara canis]|uniref:Uncharacterized protein K12H4.2 n=1 Tax=Toxocara canis TaxID=6265 RepID=A0A0B2VJR9_TOXCA|nr:Uncharacterized protein K12H4.2 [Toxocara canis]